MKWCNKYRFFRNESIFCVRFGKHRLESAHRKHPNESAHAPLIKWYGKAIVHNECVPVNRSLLGFANYHRKPDKTHALSVTLFIYCKIHVIAKAVTIEQTYKTRLSRLSCFHNIL